MLISGAGGDAPGPNSSDDSGGPATPCKGLRQLLVTLSPTLCRAMRSQIDKLMHTQHSLTAAEAGEEGAADPAASNEDVLLDEEGVAAMLGALPDSLADVADAQCPLVLPMRHLLLMLDASLPQRFELWLDGRRGDGDGDGGDGGAGGPLPRRNDLGATMDNSESGDEEEDSEDDDGMSDDWLDDSPECDEGGLPNSAGVNRRTARMANEELPWDKREVDYDQFEVIHDRGSPDGACCSPA